MRHFKYGNPLKIRNRALKEQYKILSASEKKVFRRAKCLRNIGMILVYIIFCALIVASFTLLKFVPQPEVGGWRILAFVGKVLLALLLSFVKKSIAFFLPWVTAALAAKVGFDDPSSDR